jgi:hypothetical protein
MAHIHEFPAYDLILEGMNCFNLFLSLLNQIDQENGTIYVVWDQKMY